ncbi:MAG: DUF1641 domain-containing protein [Candidatus Thermoplasmatota archaeon]|jgi:uncharacterized protein YjgD (DUF1641 family)|nr:DUF1641 domain-containing protein [Candidatus Thermoplasmatota archaeon]MCL5962941.1 DUF1641 domain-containing protein [Candidatus Thermoplasmatota archaeon]
MADDKVKMDKSIAVEQYDATINKALKILKEMDDKGFLDNFKIIAEMNPVNVELMFKMLLNEDMVRKLGQLAAMGIAMMSIATNPKIVEMVNNLSMNFETSIEKAENSQPIGLWGMYKEMKNPQLNKTIRLLLEIVKNL